MSEKSLKKYTLSESPAITNAQFLHIAQSTPKEHIYSRPAKGGGTWDYVTGVYVKKVLNFAFGWQWSFEVKDHGKEEDLIWVLGKLTIFPGTDKQIVKEQFGRADAKKKKTGGFLDYGNDLKAATTDALKKCASELGIASDIYGAEEFKNINKSEFEEDGISELDAATIRTAKNFEELVAICNKMKKMYKEALISPIFEEMKTKFSQEDSQA